MALDFSKNSRDRLPNYLARRQQRRLLMWVLAVGLVLLLVDQARNIDRWQTLLAAADRPAAPPKDPAPRVRAPEAASQLFPGVDTRLLRQVRDDTVFRASEADAFYHLLRLLADTPPDQIQKASTGLVSRTQLYAQPSEYRGDLVTITGVLRRGTRLQASRNSYRIGEFYQLWIEPRDESEPLVAWCLELPAGLSGGMQLNEPREFDTPIELTGFSYKRWAYLAGDGIRTAPIILARTPHSTAPTAPSVSPSPPISIAAAILIALVISTLAVLILVARTSSGLSRLRIGPGAAAQARASAETDSRIRRELAHLTGQSIPADEAADAPH